MLVGYAWIRFDWYWILISPACPVAPLSSAPLALVLAVMRSSCHLNTQMLKMTSIREYRLIVHVYPVIAGPDPTRNGIKSTWLSTLTARSLTLTLHQLMRPQVHHPLPQLSVASIASFPYKHARPDNSTGRLALPMTC